MFQVFNMTSLMVACGCLSAVLTSAQAQAPRKITIPAGEFSAALESLVEQTGIQLLYDIKQVEGLHTHGVRDADSAQAALRALLKGTALTIKPDASGAILIAPLDTAQTTAASSRSALAAVEGSRRSPSASGSEFGSRAVEEQTLGDGGPYLGEVLVTGSRLLSTRLNASSPVIVLSGEEIRASGAASIGELLRELPAAGASASESAGRGNNGSATVALRGLSAVNTLVLINGRRVLANNADGTVDLNSIPFDALERVEVLQDGASAVYGADAIAGVINLIMARDFDGLLLKGAYGLSSRGDLPDRKVGLTFGRNSAGRQFVFSASWSDLAGNLIADRPVSRDPDWRHMGGRNFRDPLPAHVVVTGLDPDAPSRELILRDGVSQANSRGDFREFIFPGAGTPLTSGNDGFNYWQYESSAVDIEKSSLWFSGAYDLRAGLSVFAEASYNNRQSFGFLAPDFFGAAYGEPVTVSAGNDYNPFGVDLNAARTLIEQLDYPQARSRLNDVDANTYRMVTGLQGAVGAWSWNVSYNHQQLHQSTYAGRNRVLERIRQAAGDSDACRAADNGCVPLNLLGEPGTITPAMLDFISEDRHAIVRTRLDSIVGDFTGKSFELPAGEVNLALGAEYRIEEFAQSGATIEQGTNPNPHPPARQAGEAYAEAALPLLGDIPLVRRLDLDLALRFSRYNDFGSTTNPKIGLKWRPDDDLLIRASWGTGFRAPTFTETYESRTRTFQPVQDPCLGQDYAAYPACKGQRAVTTAQGAFVVRGGNPDLEPEESENLTVGMVWTPAYVPGLALTLDYYRIEKSGLVGTANVDHVIAQNALQGRFADRVVRDAGNAVFEVVVTRDNLLRQHIHGLDLGAQYRASPSSLGLFRARVDVSYLASHRRSPAVDQPPVEYVGTYTVEGGTLAKYRGSGSLSWSRGNFDVTTAVRYVDGVLNTGSLLINGRHLHADDYVQNDVLLSYRVGDTGATLSVGVENAFDEMPPWLEGNYVNGFDPGSFHSRGRFFYTRIEKRL